MFFSRYFELLDSLTQTTAARLHFASSTTAAVLFSLVALGISPVWTLPIVLVIDLSTAYTVIAGVNADRYKEEIPAFFFQIHVLPGVLSYIVLIFYIISLVVYPLDVLFWCFLPLWALAYVTGAWAFFKLR